MTSYGLLKIENMSFWDKIKINPVFRTIRYFPESFKFRKLNKQKEQQKEQRQSGFIDEKFLRIKELKDIYHGKRCFIVATGPSLSVSDLEMIKGEISFGMNSIIHLFKDTSWRPDFYGIQDVFVFDKMKQTIFENYPENSNVLIGDNLVTDDDITAKNYIVYPFNSDYHAFEINYRKYFCKFSDDAYGMVYDGYSITYSLIQIAVYMGFKEIYLLGCDCSYKKGGNNHVVESGHVDKYDYLNRKKMVIGYEKAEEYARNNGVDIYNATRGGELEVFRRVRLEDVLSKKAR